MKQNIAKYLLYLTLGLVMASYLPWIYHTKIYYILRYAIMGSMAVSAAVTFSFDRYFSVRFMRIFAITIGIVLLEFILFHFTGKRFHVADLTQLVIAFLCIGIGMSLDCDIKTWSNICYFYTIGLIIMGVINCFYWAGGLYIPEYYMFDKGKNQVGGILAIAGMACLFFGIHIKEQRIHFLVLFILALLVLLLIRARSAFFALLLCATFITVKDTRWHWDVKMVLTILGFALIGYILYSAFLSDELHTFMVGGKRSGSLDVITSNRWQRDKEGLEYILNESVVGEQESKSGILLIHNYILLRLVRYGIWSFAMVGFYLYFGIKTIIALLSDRKTDIRDIGYITCALPLIISFVEPNFPYGPGSVQMLAFLLLGATFYNKQQQPRHAILAHDGEPAKVLHICNDFPNSKVHAELYQQLDKIGVDQVVYSPIRSQELDGRNAFEGEHTGIIYSFILKPLHRIFFHRKITMIAKDVAKKVDLSHIACSHATNLFSDGAVALYLKRHYGIPYIVAVRNTDLNAFLRYAPHLWWVHRAVIRDADKVVFISPALQRRLTNHWTLAGMRELLRGKSLLIPNGVNEYWLNHIQSSPAAPDGSHNVLYVGLFDDNKNVLRLMQAVSQLKTDIPDIHLDLVGGDGNREQEVLALVKQHPDTFRYRGKIYDKSELQKVYAENRVFAMPSLHETFGLVYVEALTQGLSLLYTRNEGIDGLFYGEVGLAVNPQSTTEIVYALQNLMLHPGNYTNSTVDFSLFHWADIAHTYLNIYHDISQ